MGRIECRMKKIKSDYLLEWVILEGGTGTWRRKGKDRMWKISEKKEGSE